MQVIVFGFRGHLFGVLNGEFCGCVFVFEFEDLAPTGLRIWKSFRFTEN